MDLLRVVPFTDRAKTVEQIGIHYRDEEKPPARAHTPGEYLEHSFILTMVIALMGLGYLVNVFVTQGGLAAMDLNTYNFMFLIAGMLLHRTPGSFLTAAAKSIPMTGGVLLQFPLYAGIFGILMGSGLTEILSRFFVSISTQGTSTRTVSIQPRMPPDFRTAW